MIIETLNKWDKAIMENDEQRKSGEATDTDNPIIQISGVRILHVNQLSSATGNFYNLLMLRWLFAIFEWTLFTFNKIYHLRGGSIPSSENLTSFSRAKELWFTKSRLKQIFVHLKDGGFCSIFQILLPNTAKLVHFFH